MWAELSQTKVADKATKTEGRRPEGLVELSATEVWETNEFQHSIWYNASFFFSEPCGSTDGHLSNLILARLGKAFARQSLVIICRHRVQTYYMVGWISESGLHSESNISIKGI